MRRPRAPVLPPTNELVLGDLLQAFEERAPDDATAARLGTLRSVPIGRLGAADVRFLLAHAVAPSLLLPLALGRLEVTPWLRAEERAGDLLAALFAESREALRLRPALAARALRVLERALAEVPRDCGDLAARLDDAALRAELATAADP